MTIIKSKMMIVLGEGEDAKLLIFTKPDDCEREYRRLKRQLK
ncbi:hypothetical protein WKW50_07250 [Ochrobactrum sp. GPK 3]